MSWLDSFLHPEKGYGKAQDQLANYYNQGQAALQPYNQSGQDAYGNLSGAMQNLLNPAALQSQWMQGYNESPSAKNTEAMAQQHGLDAASSMGLMGSNTALNAIQGGTTQIGLDDRQNYLNDLMQKYLAGTGIAQNIYGTGASSAGAMSNNAMNMGGNAAQMAFGKQNAPGDAMTKLIGMGLGGIGTLAGNVNYNPTGSAWSFGGK